LFRMLDVPDKKGGGTGLSTRSLMPARSPCVRHERKLFLVVARERPDGGVFAIAVTRRRAGGMLLSHRARRCRRRFCLGRRHLATRTPRRPEVFSTASVGRRSGSFPAWPSCRLKRGDLCVFWSSMSLSCCTSGRRQAVEAAASAGSRRRAARRWGVGRRRIAGRLVLSWALRANASAPMAATMAIVHFSFHSCVLLLFVTKFSGKSFDRRPARFCCQLCGAPVCRVSLFMVRDLP